MHPSLFLIVSLFDILGIDHLSGSEKNRLVYSAFCLLFALILTYFWYISLDKIKATKRDGKGLVYLAFSFVLFASIGLVSIFNSSPRTTLLILSSLVSFSFLSSLSYFSGQRFLVERWVHTDAWKNGIKYVAFTWIIILTLSPSSSVIVLIENILAVVSVLTLGIFLTKYFAVRKLGFIALLTAIYFGTYAILQLIESGSLSGGKFTHVNTAFLTPAIGLAIIVLAYTFNWINELNFHQLSSIWTEQDPSPSVNDQQSVNDSELGTNAITPDQWTTMIAADQIERVIKERIIQQQLRNENLELILNIAARNNRNNDNHLKDLIPYDEYQRNRNKISQALMSSVNQ